MQKLGQFRSLVHLSKFRASGGHNVQSNAPVRPDILKSEDMTAFRDYANLTPEKQDKLLSTANLLPKIGILYQPVIAKFFATTFETTKAETRSDVYFPPKLHENGIHLYSSLSFGRPLRYARSYECLFLGSLFFTAHPLFYMGVASLAYFIFGNAFFYELSRRMVIRMDLLPHTQQIAVQKVGAFGQVLTKLVKIEDLEKVNFEELEQKENYFWNVHYNTVDVNLIFRDRTTKELFVFDRNGLWDRDTLEHELLN